MNERIYFKGLNGIRAIAALAVVFSHTTGMLGLFGLNAFIFGQTVDGTPVSTNLAGFGVTIFFALSGFLITYLLLQEKSSATINLKHFYIRRILRIWPLYYSYLAISLITLWLFSLPIDSLPVLFTIFLLPNIPFANKTPISFTRHYWSLGIEEQFYAIWPVILKKIRVKSVFKITAIIIVFLVALKFVARLIEIKYLISLPYTILNDTTRFQYLLIGAAGAELYFEKNSLLIKFATNIFTQFVVWLIIILVAINKFHVVSVLDNEIISLVTVMLIVGQIESKGVINLENKVFNFIGKISYGIYIVHPLIIFYLSKIFGKLNQYDFFCYLLVYISVFVITIVIAYLSYEFFESKFLRIKKKYETIKTVT